MQKDYPSVVEMLFEQAIRRLKKVVKLRKEAIDYYQSHFGHSNSKGSLEPRESTGGNYIQIEKEEVKHETSKFIANNNATLKQIEEIDESGTESSNEPKPRERFVKKRTKARTSKFRTIMNKRRSQKADD